MRYLLPLLSLALLANCYPYPVHAQPYGSPPGSYPPSPPPPPGQSPPPSPSVGRPRPYAGGQAYSPENCGTPDEPKPCPPMPRVPLQYYPANRE